ncbi:conserved hypothetical protein [Segniliparus rotundus DSM 44985]|uniref:Uncharacterized protein n=1 Tax=Segniliparus rotundus (strain ATCC BAA-972 / CDC 1076 / CIP 108378 / DSM 44985 / JCM 13578) TaxID=640132 RepID=D6ZFG3_SEGRD|nr:hypothetical protein [Segniliparus rotundus]ADG97687.1 conserved hypothetical protein [Segniliparus rotundus DSM 44985]
MFWKLPAAASFAVPDQPGNCVIFENYARASSNDDARDARLVAKSPSAATSTRRTSARCT